MIYFNKKLGIIRSLSYDWLFNGGKWETTAGVRMPQGCTVTMSYQVIHENLANRDTDFYGGPAGGLNAATERYRMIEGQTDNAGAFDVFSETTTTSAGYGGANRFIPAGAESTKTSAEGGLGEKSFLGNVNNKGPIEESVLQGLQNVPIGVDTKNPEEIIELIYADEETP